VGRIAFVPIEIDFMFGMDKHKFLKLTAAERMAFIYMWSSLWHSGGSSLDQDGCKMILRRVLISTKDISRWLQDMEKYQLIKIDGDCVKFLGIEEKRQSIMKKRRTTKPPENPDSSGTKGKVKVNKKEKELKDCAERISSEGNETPTPLNLQDIDPPGFASPPLDGAIDFTKGEDMGLIGNTSMSGGQKPKKEPDTGAKALFDYWASLVQKKFTHLRKFEWRGGSKESGQFNELFHKYFFEGAKEIITNAVEGWEDFKKGTKFDNADYPNIAIILSCSSTFETPIKKQFDTTDRAAGHKPQDELEEADSDWL